MQSRREMAMHIPYIVFLPPSAALWLYEYDDGSPDGQSEFPVPAHSRSVPLIPRTFLLRNSLQALPAYGNSRFP